MNVIESQIFVSVPPGAQAVSAAPQEPPNPVAGAEDGKVDGGSGGMYKFICCEEVENQELKSFFEVNSRLCKKQLLL